MKIGEVYEFAFLLTQDQVIRFAQVTGDDNPLHLDSEYAASTVFEQCVVHGFLGGSVFSRVFGTLWPGKGTIYLSQSLQFKRPIYVAESYRAQFEVMVIDDRKCRATIKTQVINKQGKVVIDGEAVIQLPANKTT